MKKFDYIVDEPMKSLKEIGELEDYLDSWGDYGWELVGIQQNKGDDRFSDYTFYIFKRDQL